MTGDRARCEEAIRYCLTHKPAADDAAAYNLWSLVLRSQGEDKNQEAERKLTSALARLAGNEAAPQLAAAIYTNWGSLLSSQGKLAPARNMYEQALAFNAVNAHTLFNYGLAWQKENNRAMAEEKYRQAIEVDHELTSAYTNLAYVLWQQGKIDDALTQTKRLEQISQGTDVYLNWGFLLEQKKNFALALRQYERAIELDPGLPEAYEGKARAYLELGDLLSAAANAFRAGRLREKVAP